MTERDEMAALADKLEFAANNTEGCLYSQRKMLNAAAQALRSASRTGPGFAEHKKQISRIVYGIYGLGRGDFGGGHQNASIEKAVEAIAALPAPAGTTTGWQPIETAPKDGTPIIGAFWSIRWADSHRKGDVVTCWWQPEFEAFISSCREMTLAQGLTFENGSSRELHSPVIEPVTHWKLLDRPTITRKSQSEAGS